MEVSSGGADLDVSNDGAGVEVSRGGDETGRGAPTTTQNLRLASAHLSTPGLGSADEALPAQPHP